MAFKKQFQIIQLIPVQQEQGVFTTRRLIKLDGVLYDSLEEAEQQFKQATQHAEPGEIFTIMQTYIKVKTS